MNVFEVTVTYQGTFTYKVKAPDPQRAKKLAEMKFEAFEVPDQDGHNDKIINIEVAINQADQTGGSDAATETTPTGT